tara:strand:- start:1525 stop:1806 length:282 start_codon:yes stop_codon:yes gene_type:complete
MAFKMKGSPMKRNFGVGSPLKQDEKSKYTGGWSNKIGDAYYEARDRRNKKEAYRLAEKRKGLKKGSDEYNRVQNRINSLLGDPTRHVNKKGER